MDATCIPVVLAPCAPGEAAVACHSEIVHNCWLGHWLLCAAALRTLPLGAMCKLPAVATLGGPRLGDEGWGWLGLGVVVLVRFGEARFGRYCGPMHKDQGEEIGTLLLIVECVIQN